MALVKVGFIGCGNHARTNLYPALRLADCELLAVADLHAERRDWAARVFGAPRAYDDYRKLLADEPDLQAVFISGPPALHHEAGIAAMERGLDVMVEKPPAPSLEATLELQQVSRRTGRRCCVAFMKRFARHYVRARELATAPEFGRPTHLLIRYSYNTPRMGIDSMLTTMCTHAIDLARFFMGDVVRLQVERGGLEDVLQFLVNLRFASGAAGTLVMSSQAPGVLERVELTGQRAMVTVEDLTRLEYFPPSDSSWTPPQRIVQQPNMALQTLDNQSMELQGYLGEVRAFVRAVGGGDAGALATIDDGVAAMRIADILASDPAGPVDCS